MTAVLPAEMPAPTLTVDGLVVDRGGRRVLDGVRLTLSAGEALLVTGENGVGKSTLIRALLGLVRPRAGRISLDGTAIEEAGEIGRQTHHLGHRDGVKTAMTLAENLAFWRDFLGGGKGGGRVEAALAAVGLEALVDLPAAYLSAGQRRRLAIARLLVVRRPIWLLDEPTTALDAASTRRFAALAADHVRSGGSILMASHHDLDIPGARELRLVPPTLAAAAAPW